MTPLTRYDFGVDLEDGAQVIESATGSWVKAADADALLTEQAGEIERHRKAHKMTEMGDPLDTIEKLMEELAAKEASIAQLQAMVIELGGKP